MADTQVNDTADSAEKAYAAAAAKTETPTADKPVANEPEFVPAPALVAEVAAPAAKPAAPVTAKPVADKPAKAKVARKPAAKKAPAVKKAPAAKVAKVAKAAPAKAAKPAARKAATPKSRVTKPAIANLSVPQLKEKIMAKTNTNDFAQNFKSAVADAQGKAKVAYDKGQAAFGEATEFTKGNVEALVESTKILGSGLQELTTSYVAESRSAFETLTADVRALAAVKSPVDFFKLQGEIARRNFDKAITFGSKNSEAVLKLTNDVVAPISGRVSLAVEKVKKAA
jgi:hypothetical protein